MSCVACGILLVIVSAAAYVGRQLYTRKPS